MKSVLQPAVIEPGLIVLHGNRLELLRDAVFDWLGRNPLEPLEEEIFLVQSNGAGEWLKMGLARAAGVCAATRVELPGRFLWKTYRQVLGRDRVLQQSVLEKDALTWRLMRLLPEQLARPAFASVAAFLDGDDADRRLQLARRLADLYDQYQMYRADWLAAWEKGRPVLPVSATRDEPLPADQRWQVELWRAILADLSKEDRRSTRPHVHRAFIDAMTDGRRPIEALPRRVVLFGASHIPVQGLEALAALSSHVQVILAVPNPCRFHWADIVEGRDALHALRVIQQRHPSTGATDLSATPLDAMHLHAHPLLAAWGRQGRDFMRQLDAFDDANRTRERFDLPRIDLFDDGPGTTLLEQVQVNIRDLVPLAEHPADVVDARDRSIVFHVAHGVQREVEILHDQLLSLLASKGGALRPRDVVVMVPDVEVFAPSIRAVFGQYPADDARHIPFDIADLRSRGSNPLVTGLEWLLRISEKRIGLQEVRDLLDVPAIARRVGIETEAVPALFAWLAGAGVRWGLHAEHRAHLGLGATGEQNSWLFGIRRMLLGYAAGTATGDANAFAGVQPYGEVGGLDAAVVGSLAELFARLDRWWSLARDDATPGEWATHSRALLLDLFAPTDERERLTIAALQAALSAWLQSCEAARYVDEVPLSVLREAWLSGIDGLAASRRFLTGGVTFCTLMPLRAVPFDVVCLLGMNDGAFPRRTRQNDFDLMALPGQQRPGDRSRRDDDRYLMLEALLSARRVLYVSWCGRSARDNSVQPPSVLVSQLRDYVAAAWRGADERDVLADRTTVHPLQPFSRRYFEGAGLVTFAREWRAAHVVDAADAAVVAQPVETVRASLTVDQLVRFLGNPVREFFKARLDVRVADGDVAMDDDEAFGLDGLERYRLRDELLDDPEAMARDGIDGAIERRLRRLEGSGRLPLFAGGARVIDEMASTIGPMLERWIEYRQAYPHEVPRLALRVELVDERTDAEVVVDDWLDGLRSDGAERIAIAMTPSRVVDHGGKAIRVDRLLAVWVRMLVASACGYPVEGVVIGSDATLSCRPLERDAARAALDTLLMAWRAGMVDPLPFASKTALAFVSGANQVAAIYDGGYAIARGEGSEFCLRRVFPDYEALTADGRFERYAHRLFAPLREWVDACVAILPAGDPLVIVAPEDVA